MKTVYFCSVTHDLQTPLNSISATTEHLMHKFRESKEEQYLLKVIQSSCSFLMRIIEDMTDLSKIELKEFQVEPQWFDLEQVLRDISDLMQIPFDLKKIGLQFQITDEILCSGSQVYSDFKRIKQILLNLIGNALKFTFREQVRVKVDLLEDIEDQEEDIVVEERKEEEELGELEPDRILQFRVIDTGVGIKPENRSQLFKLFGKVKEHSFANKQGIGLGLTICKRLSELLGGTINLESETGRGTTITFTVNCKVKQVMSSSSLCSLGRIDSEVEALYSMFDKYINSGRKSRIMSQPLNE